MISGKIGICFTKKKSLKKGDIFENLYNFIGLYIDEYFFRNFIFNNKSIKI